MTNLSSFTGALASVGLALVPIIALAMNLQVLTAA
jgi:hypothetical protein